MIPQPEEETLKREPGFWFLLHGVHFGLKGFNILKTQIVYDQIRIWPLACHSPAPCSHSLTMLIAFLLHSWSAGFNWKGSLPNLSTAFKTRERSVTEFWVHAGIPSQSFRKQSRYAPLFLHLASCSVCPVLTSSTWTLPITSSAILQIRILYLGT